MKKIINSTKAPKAIGPYSQAVEVGGTLYISGQIPVDVVTGKFSDDVAEQTEQVMKNIGYILSEAGYNYNNVVKSTIFIKNMNDFATINAIYAKYYTSEMPARSTVEVSKLPLGVSVEIETIAVK
ncbi:MAG: RidA family protein [Rikenellaceae bacterium]